MRSIMQEIAGMMKEKGINIADFENHMRSTKNWL